MKSATWCMTRAFLLAKRTQTSNVDHQPTFFQDTTKDLFDDSTALGANEPQGVRGIADARSLKDEERRETDSVISATERNVTCSWKIK